MENAPADHHHSQSTTMSPEPDTQNSWPLMDASMVSPTSTPSPGSASGDTSPLVRAQRLVGRVPLVRHAASFAWQRAAQLRRGSQLEAFYQQPEGRNVALGAGFSQRHGWLSTDILPRSFDCVYVDLTAPLPFESNTIDRFHLEHVIEHISFVDGQHLLAECLRSLRPGGRVRVATPDLSRLVRLISEPLDDERQGYVRWSNTTFGGPVEHHDDPVVAFNRVVREWGHQFIYTPSLLSEELTRAGYDQIQEYQVGESDDEVLSSIEDHSSQVPTRWNLFETFVLEAAKPTTDERP